MDFLGFMLGLILFPSPFIFLLVLLIIISNSPSGEFSYLPKISFQLFYDFYSLSPNTWKLNEEYVEKLTPNEILKFTFIKKDYRKYQKFFNRLKKKDKAEENFKIQQYENKQMIKLLEVVQEEINTIKAQSVREIEDSTKTMMEIQDRIMEGNK